MKTNPMMACGHAANAVTAEGAPCCAICAGTHPEALLIAPAPSLAGREAECTYCGRRAPSATGLAFFGHRPKGAVDSFYCGCHGWN